MRHLMNSLRVKDSEIRHSSDNLKIKLEDLKKKKIQINPSTKQSKNSTQKKLKLNKIKKK